MRYTLSISFLIITSFFLHFYNISWGYPYFFHPDERNIASSISQLVFPINMNPHFFAYGSLPIYSTYFLGIINNIFKTPDIFTVFFEQAILLSRYISALFATFTVVIVYVVGKNLHSKTVGIITSFFAVFSIGFTQYAHFGTFEMWLTFFSILLTYICFSYITNPAKKTLFLIGILQGILISIKVSSVILFLPILVTLGLQLLTHRRFYKRNLILLIIQFFSIVFLSFIILVITNPFIFLDSQSFWGSMNYETSVALGTLPVFYTEGFKNSLPIYYQFVHVYPFILNPFVTIFFIFSFLYILWKIIKTKNQKLFILIIFFLSILLSQTTVFVKWTRYIIPTLPYIYLMIGYTLIDLLHLIRIKKVEMTKGIKVLIAFLMSISFLYSLYFFYEVYILPDTRTQAYIWAKNHIHTNNHILSEVYDLGIVPFNDSYSNISLFNFYDLETNEQLVATLKDELKRNDYIILPSQRLLKNRLLYPNTFPKGNSFYKDLFDEQKYKKVYETPCNLFCKIVYNGNPVFHLEETATVFDRPTVYIFKKQ